MKKILSVWLIFAGSLAVSGCVPSESADVVALDIHSEQICFAPSSGAENRKMTSRAADETLFLRFDTDSDSLDGKSQIKIPPDTKRLHLFKHDFDLPGSAWRTFFRSAKVNEITPQWYDLFSRPESHFVFCMISFSEEENGNLLFKGELLSRGISRGEHWDSMHFFSCIVTPDGQIFNDPRSVNLRENGGGAFFTPSMEFGNRNGELTLQIRERGRYWKYWMQKSIVLHGLPRLPDSSPRLLTRFKLNLPFMEKALETAPETFAVRKNPEDLRRFGLLLEKLHFGMTPEEASALLGAPDSSSVSAPKESHDIRSTRKILQYYFLRARENSVNMSDLYLTLDFLFDEAAGKYILSSVY